MADDAYAKCITILLLITTAFVFVFFLRYNGVVKEKAILEKALQNSGITCKPVKVNDELYCSTAIYINKGDTKDTLNVSNVEFNPK